MEKSETIDILGDDDRINQRLNKARKEIDEINK